MNQAPPPFGRTVPGNDWSVLDGIRPDPGPVISVVVVHFEQHDDLARTLAALAAQSHPAERTEIVVVDDGSAVAPVVADGVRLIVQEDLGFRASAARNAGAAAATGDVLCFLDADTSPEPGYLAAMARLPALAPETVTVGRRRHADLSGDGEILPEPAWLADAYAASRNLLDSDERSYRYVIGAVLACSRWFFDEVGGFDESFTSYGGEDWEWAHRAWIAGAVFAHVPDAVAWHNGPDAAIREFGDPEAARQKKNRETVALVHRIAVPGATGHGVVAAQPDVVARVPSGEPAAVYQCVDTILRALPTARVVVDPSLETFFTHDSRVGSVVPERGYRTLVTVSRLFSVRADDMARFAETLSTSSTQVGRGTLGSASLAGDGVEILVESSRLIRRLERWGKHDGWTRTGQDFPLHAISADHTLAGYLGGWAE